MPDDTAFTRQVTTGALPASRKVHVTGQRYPDIRVAMRDIGQTGDLEPDVRVYDTSGPYSDPDVTIDIEKGLAPLRRDWILARGDVEEYDGRPVKPIDNGFNENGREIFAEFPSNGRKSLRAKTGKTPTQLAYARAGIVTAEMEYIAIRENLGRKTAAKAPGLNLEPPD